MAKKIKTASSDWLPLYHLAIKARDLAPWQWMFEDEIFGLQIPGDPTTYYCSIMGRNGEHLSYCFYRGDSGLSKYQKLREQALTERFFSPMQMLRFQDCIQVSFENSDLIEPEQKKQIASLGLRFRGNNQWVSIKDFTPGWYPWLIVPDQIQTLETLLPKAMEVALKKRQEPGWFGAWESPGQSMPVFILNDQGIWEESRPSVNPHEALPTDRAALFPTAWQYLAKLPSKNAQIACGHMFHNTVVQEKSDDRPYYVNMLVLLDMKEDAILGITTTPPEQDAEQEKDFLQNFQNMGFRPKKILVADPETLDFLQPGCALAGIGLALDELASQKINFIAEYMMGVMGSK